MAWRKAFPSPLLLFSFFLLTFNNLNSPSHAFQPNQLSLASHMREYAVYANEHGVPKLERGDSPAKDPQIIQDTPISSDSPTLPQQSPPASASQPSPSPSFSEPTPAHDTPSTVSDVAAPSSSANPSASTTPSAPPASPAPEPPHQPLSGSAAVNDADNDHQDQTHFSDDLAISATADDFLEEPLIEPEETPYQIDDFTSNAHVNDAAAQPESASGQSAAPSGDGFKPSSTLSGGQTPLAESQNPMPQSPSPFPQISPHDPGLITGQSADVHEEEEQEEHMEEEEPLESPLLDEPSAASALVKTPAPSLGWTKNGNSKPSAVVKPNAPVIIQVEDNPPVPDPQPSQSVSPLPSPGQSAPEEVLETPLLEDDDSSSDSTNEKDVSTEEIEDVPVVAEAEEDEPTANAAAAQVATAVAPSASSPTPAPSSKFEDEKSSAVEHPSNEAKGVDLNDVEIDDSFTCTYFGKGSMPNFQKPDENSFTGEVSTFTAGPNDFPDLDPQYLSHVHGASWSYSFSVDASYTYDVVLGFAEVYAVACEQGEDSGFRVFDASVGEQTTRIDVMSVVGCGKPLQQVYPKVATSGNTITLVFQQISQHAMLSTMCYRKSVPMTSMSPSMQPTPSPLGESSVVVTAVPPNGPSEGEAPTSSESSDLTPEKESSDSSPQNGSKYACINFGPETIEGYKMYKSKSVSGDIEVYAGSGQYNNALPEPYWYYVHGQNWSYSLEVSSSAPQNIMFGYAETFSDACDKGKSFVVSVNGGTQEIDVTENIGCGVIYQAELKAVSPVNGAIDISFAAKSGDAMISVMCYADASETEAATSASAVAIKPAPEASGSGTEEETPSSPESTTSTDPASPTVMNDSSAKENGGSCFSFGKNAVPGFLHAEPLPSDISFYNDAEASVSAAGDSSVFSSHVYGSHIGLSISTKDQAPKSVFVGFAEIYEPACVKDQRLFKLSIGSLTKNVDVFDEIGCSAALILRIDDVIPDNANTIAIELSAIKDNAMISTVCVTESVGNSIGKPAISVVGELPPVSMLDNLASISVGSEEPQNNPATSEKTPTPSPTFVTVTVPIDETSAGGVVNSGDPGDGNPAGSPFPEVDGLIDATITDLLPSPDGSLAASNPTGSPQTVEMVNPTHANTDESDSGDKDVEDVLLHSNFSQTTFGETAPLASPSPPQIPSSDVVFIVPMHPTGSDSGGFPQSAAVQDVESIDNDDGSNESEVIVVIDENFGPSPSPSASIIPGVMDTSTDSGSATIEAQSVSPSSPPSPIPTSGVIIAIEAEDPSQEAPSSSEKPTTSGSSESDVILSVGEGATQAPQSPTPVSGTSIPSPVPTSEVTIVTGEVGPSQTSQDPVAVTVSPSPSSDSAVILVAANEDSAIPPTSETSTVATTVGESDLESEPTPSVTPAQESSGTFATAIPPGSTSTNDEDNNNGSSNDSDSDEAAVVAVDSGSVTVAVDPQQSSSPPSSPVSVAIQPDDSGDRNDVNEESEVQVLVPDADGAPSTELSSSETDDVVLAVDASGISLQPSPSPAATIAPGAMITNNQIEIVISSGPTVTPTPGTTSAASSGDDAQDVIIIDSDSTDASSIEAPDGVSLESETADEATTDIAGLASSSPSPSASLIVSVTGSNTVIVTTTGAEASPIPVPSAIPVAAPEAVVEVPDTDEDVIEVAESENEETVDSSALSGDENVPSIIEGDYKELIGTVPVGNGFSIGMGILGALLVLLLIILLFFAIRSDGVAYSYSSQYSSRKPSDYGDASQGGYTEGLNQEGGGGYQNESYAGEGLDGYSQGQPTMESQPIDGAENFGYEKPEEGLGGTSGSYGNVRPDTYAAYSSLNLQDGPTTMDEGTNMYSQSEGVTMEGEGTFHYGSGTRETTFSGSNVRESEQPTEYGDTTQEYTEMASREEADTSMMGQTETEANDFEQRISMFGGRRASNRTSYGQEADEEHSFHENRSVARPNFRSASSGNQGREYGMDLVGTGYETVTKEEREQYNALQQEGRNSAYVTDTRVGSGYEGSERMQSMSSTPTAAPSPYEADMLQGQITDSDSGNAYQRSPVLAPSESVSVASTDIGPTHDVRITINGGIHNDEVLDDFQHNDSSLRESARHGHGTMELQSELSNDGPWPWWWSDQKDKKGIFSQSSSPADVEHGNLDKENSSLPSNNQSAAEQSSSGLSTEDAKAAVVVEDAVILKPSEIAKIGHLPMVGSKWQRQYSSTSDETNHERFEKNPYFDELRKRREPYVKTVANRLSVGVNPFSPESGESLLEQARKEYEEQHLQQHSMGFNGNDPASWVTQGVEV